MVKLCNAMESSLSCYTKNTANVRDDFTCESNFITWLVPGSPSALTTSPLQPLSPVIPCGPIGPVSPCVIMTTTSITVSTWRSQSLPLVLLDQVHPSHPMTRNSVNMTRNSVNRWLCS